ncbi:MAG: hypothetical protein VYA89_08660 [Actinomycetota bacterium]|nr:hypothetical protein [Actinomycetota bacterium]
MADTASEYPPILRCTAWADPVDDPAALARKSGIVAVDLVDRERLHLLAERGMRAESPPWSALIWSLPTSDLPGQRTLLNLDLVRHDGWGDPDTGTPDAVLMVSLVSASPGLDHATFASRYRAHIDVARKHHGFAAYRQNVTATPGTGPDAVSEILLASEVDWRRRFYVGKGSAAAVGADVANFLDRRTTSSTIVRRFAGGRGDMLRQCEG